MQKDLKRLVAYSSVAHLGFIVLGYVRLHQPVDLRRRAADDQPRCLHRRVVPPRRHDLRAPPHPADRRAARASRQVAPIFAAVFTLVMLSSIGVPGLNGFVGEFLVLIGSFLTARWWTVVAATGVIIAALYLLWAYQRVFHGEPDEANKSFRELSMKEGLVMLPLLGLIVFCGVYPKPMLDRIQPSVDALIAAHRGQDRLRPAAAGAVRGHRAKPRRSRRKASDVRPSCRLRRPVRSTGGRCRRCSSLLGGGLLLLVAAALTPHWPRGSVRPRQPPSSPAPRGCWRRSSGTT